MRFMVMVKATKNTEAGVLPSKELLDRDGQVQRGAGEGRRHARRRGAPRRARRARASGSRATKRTVIDGPFAETKELIAGFWLWQVKSMEEAIEWVKRCPNPMPGEAEIEIRQVFEAEDFGAEFTPELREQEERSRSRRSEAAHERTRRATLMEP